MSDPKWKCEECGYEENTGKFCNRCGAPRDDVRQDIAAQSDLTSRLTCFTLSSHISGMMAYSAQHYVKEIKWAEDGSVVLTDTEEMQCEYRKERSYKVEPEDSEKLLEIIERYDVPAWTGYRYDYTAGPIVMDRSVSNTLTLIYSRGSGRPEERFSIDLEGVKQQGRSDQVREISALLDSMADDSNLIDSSEEVLTMPNGMSKKDYFASFNMKSDRPADSPSSPVITGNVQQAAEPGPGEWRCPECGTINGGKFCCNCGSAKV